MSSPHLIYLIEARAVDDTGADRAQYWSAGTTTLHTYGGIRWKSCVLNASGGSGPYTYTVGFPLGENIGGAARPGFGAITLGRHRGDLAELLALHFDGRPLRIWRVPEGSTFVLGPVGSLTVGTQPIFEGTCDTPTFTSGTVTIPLRDMAALVDVPAQTHTYAGTGGLEGGPELTGQVKPWVVGRGLSIEPVALDHAAPGPTTAGTVFGAASNHGNGTCTGVGPGVAPQAGTYTLICREAIANGGRFELLQSDGGSLGSDYTMTAGAGNATSFTTTQVVFTLNDGTTDFAVGDKFLFAVQQSYSRVVQISDGVIKNNLSIYERGEGFGASDLVFVSDVYAWTPIAGKVAVDLKGYARFGVIPDGIITVDVDADLVASDHANLAVQVLLRDPTRFVPDDIDSTAMGAFQAAQPTPSIILTIKDQRTIGQILDDLATSAGAFWTFTARRKFQMRQIGWGTPTGIITEARLTKSLENAPADPPVWHHKFGIAPLGRVLTDTDFDGAAVLPVNRARFSQSMFYVENTFHTTRATRLLARELTRDARFPALVSSPGGNFEAARQARLLQYNRTTFVATVPAPLDTYRLGDTITLQHADYGLADGADFIIREKTERPGYARDQDEVELKLWGPRIVGQE